MHWPFECFVLKGNYTHCPSKRCPYPFVKRLVLAGVASVPSCPAEDDSSSSPPSPQPTAASRDKILSVSLSPSKTPPPKKNTPSKLALEISAPYSKSVKCSFCKPRRAPTPNTRSLAPLPTPKTRVAPFTSSQAPYCKNKLKENLPHMATLPTQLWETALLHHCPDSLTESNQMA